ncbi:MAG: hypothetical protein GIX03_03250 [Candidatus Eremiobacteraeota bacterium]|nr:hypothetical protein [Candidatus Eremiobacteraeota bacterium]MBC5802030.1 hypothetical protein [Candidatus Eremiobacteraeota bacterium]
MFAGGGVPARAATALPALDHLAATWRNLHDYSVTIVAHEVMGDRSSDHELQYAFRKPHQARLDVIKGTKSGSTILWDGGDRVTAYRRGLSLFKMHGSAHDVDLTSLRGNGILNPDEGDVVACLDAHRDRIVERAGPTVDGDATDELVFSNANISCPDDPASDKDVTLDVIDVSKRTGLVVLRKRYVGKDVVEHWELKDFKIDSGLTDADLH